MEWSFNKNPYSYLPFILNEAKQQIRFRVKGSLLGLWFKFILMWFPFTLQVFKHQNIFLQSFILLFQYFFECNVMERCHWCLVHECNGMLINKPHTWTHYLWILWNMKIMKFVLSFLCLSLQPLALWFLFYWYFDNLFKRYLKQLDFVFSSCIYAPLFVLWKWKTWFGTSQVFLCFYA